MVKIGITTASVAATILQSYLDINDGVLEQDNVMDIEDAIEELKEAIVEELS